MGVRTCQEYTVQVQYGFRVASTYLYISPELENQASQMMAYPYSITSACDIEHIQDGMCIL